MLLLLVLGAGAVEPKVYSDIEVGVPTRALTKADAADLRSATSGLTEVERSRINATRKPQAEVLVALRR